MKREPDYIIDLLKEGEDSDDSIIHAREYLGMKRADRRKLHHLRLMNDAGLVAEIGKGGSSFRITNSGHDFLEASRNPRVWENVKGWIKEGMPLAAAAAKIASLFRGPNSYRIPSRRVRG